MKEPEFWLRTRLAFAPCTERSNLRKYGSADFFIAPRARANEAHTTQKSRAGASTAAPARELELTGCAGKVRCNNFSAPSP